MRKLLIAVPALLILLSLAGAPAATTAASDNPATANADLERFCNAIVVHDGVRHKNMVVFPVSLREIADSTGYTTLDEAIENGRIKITEIGSGSVPELRLEILSNEPFFFMAGEVVTGAKQDRILKHDLLFRDGKGAVNLPVYCVEQGRWTERSAQFGSGKTLGSTALRKTAVMKEGQQNAWAEVRQKNEEMRADTATDTIQATYESEKYKGYESDFLDALRGIPSQHPDTVGVVIAIGGEVVSADVFANHSLFARLWPKVLKAAITDAVVAGTAVVEDNTEARRFLGAALAATIQTQENPSQGHEFSLRSDVVQGSFIRSAHGLTHLALFTAKMKSIMPSERNQEPQLQIQQRENPHLQQSLNPQEQVFSPRRDSESS